MVNTEYLARMIKKCSTYLAAGPTIPTYTKKLCTFFSLDAAMVASDVIVVKIHRVYEIMRLRKRLKCFEMGDMRADREDMETCVPRKLGLGLA